MSDEVQIALFGFVATALVAVVSQWMQSRRERKRLELETLDRRIDRLFAHRKDAYATFITLFSERHDKYFEHTYINEAPPPDEWLHPLWDVLTDIQIFGSADAHRLAKSALADLASWIYGGRPPDGVVFDTPRERDTYFEQSSRKAFELLLMQARSDFGADRLGETPSSWQPD